MMRKYAQYAIVFFFACGLGFFARARVLNAEEFSSKNQGVLQLQAAFAPWDNIENLVVNTINHAQQQILVQAYLLTDKDIAQALIQAKQRGVIVQVLADAEKTREGARSQIPALVQAGIPVWLEIRYLNAHNKIMIVDNGLPEAVLITGSYNFTWSAQHKNAENVLIVRNNADVIGRYALNWTRHQREAIPYLK